MGEQRHYLCEFHIDGRRLYVIWYSNEKDDLVRLKDGKILSFTDQRQAHRFSRENDISLMPEPPKIFDFDMLAAWCDHPTAESMDPATFLNVWNMLDDAQSLKSDVLSLYNIRARRGGKIYDKLFFGNNLPAMTPNGASYKPIWSQEEIEALSRIYRFGLAELRANIHCVNG